MKKIGVIYFIVIFLVSCHSEEEQSGEISDVNLVSTEAVIENTDLVPKDQFIDFPIPDLDSIFPYFETSGVVSKSPSERYYNPTDSGIFVFYTLFDQKKIGNSKYSFDEKNIGTLTTHTYMKPKYGWSETDKDQTFILLQLNGQPIKIGKSIQIGMPFQELVSELGKPIFQADSTFTFLGKNKVVGQFVFEKEKLTSLTYGRFNLTDEIFELDSVSRQKIIEEKL